MSTAEELAAQAAEDEDITEDATDARDTTVVRPAIIPSKEELDLICADIKTNFDFDVDVIPVLFRFKTVVEKDSTGQVTGEVKREALELPVPYPTVKGIVSILERGGKELELLMEAVEGVITSQARTLISDNWDINATNMPLDKLSWKYISEMPKAERSGGGIAKDVWEDFGKDYIATMPEAAGKTVEQATNAAKLLVSKLAAVKTNFPVLKMLVEQLTIYVDNSKRADEFTPCVAFLVDKADKLLNTTPEELLANL